MTSWPWVSPMEAGMALSTATTSVLDYASSTWEVSKNDHGVKWLSGQAGAGEQKSREGCRTGRHSSNPLTFKKAVQVSGTARKIAPSCSPFPCPWPVLPAYSCFRADMDLLKTGGFLTWHWVERRARLPGQAFRGKNIHITECRRAEWSISFLMS